MAVVNVVNYNSCICMNGTVNKLVEYEIWMIRADAKIMLTLLLLSFQHFVTIYCFACCRNK